MTPIEHIKTMFMIHFNCCCNPIYDKGNIDMICGTMLQSVHNKLAFDKPGKTELVSVLLSGLLEKSQFNPGVLHALELDMKKKLNIESKDKQASSSKNGNADQKSVSNTSQNKSSSSNTNSSANDELNWMKKGFLLGEMK